MNALLINTYDLGRQPFGIASPAAWLRQAGHDVSCLDLSREPLRIDLVAAADLIAFYLPMHTATRLAIPVIDRARQVNPDARLCAFGLYAPLTEPLLREHGISIVLGPEFESDLVAAAAGGAADQRPEPRQGSALSRLAFIRPDRTGLPPLQKYASLQMPDGATKVVGSTDATRGCKHRCRHCPIVPVYDGQFRVVPVEIVIADIRGQVERGATHITFGDPDFFNGPTHARRIVESVHREFPSLTYDATIKVEHLLKHRDLLPALVATGCLFVTSAVESVDDAVLMKLEKGHTRADFVTVAGLCADVGLTLVPTFVAFTPWTSLDGYLDLLAVVEDLGMAEHVAPVQWGIRLLVTWQSRLLELPEIQASIGAFDRSTLTFPWRHHDPRVDRLQHEIMRNTGMALAQPRSDSFEHVRRLARAAASVDGWNDQSAHAMMCADAPLMSISRRCIPYLNEPWYC